MRLNASPLRNLAHVRMICNVTRARSSFLSEVFSALLFITDFVFSGLFHSGRCPALRHSCGETGRTAREQTRHFRARLSGTPVAPWAS